MRPMFWCTKTVTLHNSSLHQSVSRASIDFVSLPLFVVTPRPHLFHTSVSLDTNSTLLSWLTWPADSIVSTYLPFRCYLCVINLSFIPPWRSNRHPASVVIAMWCQLNKQTTKYKTGANSETCKRHNTVQYCTNMFISLCKY